MHLYYQHDTHTLARQWSQFQYNAESIQSLVSGKLYLNKDDLLELWWDGGVIASVGSDLQMKGYVLSVYWCPWWDLKVPTIVPMKHADSEFRIEINIVAKHIRAIADYNSKLHLVLCIPATIVAYDWVEGWAKGGLYVVMRRVSESTWSCIRCQAFA